MVRRLLVSGAMASIQDLIPAHRTSTPEQSSTASHGGTTTLQEAGLDPANHQELAALLRGAPQLNLPPGERKALANEASLNASAGRAAFEQSDLWLQSRAAAAPGGDKVNPGIGEQNPGEQVSLDGAEGKDKYDLFHDLTFKDPTRDVIGAYLNSVFDNPYAVDGLKDGAQFQLGGTPIDSFLNPSGKLDFRDVHQGDLPDCFFVGSAAAVIGDDPQAVKNLIQPATRDGVPGYEVSLYRPDSMALTDTEGKTVTDLDNGKVNGVSLLNGGRETVWVSRQEVQDWQTKHHDGWGDKTTSLLEVAADKIAGPGFIDGKGGDSAHALYMLTGQNSITFGPIDNTNRVLKDDPVIGPMSNAALFRAGEEALASGHSITFGMTGTNLNAYGMDPSFNLKTHAFQLVDVTPDGLILRNPWAGVEPGSQYGKPGTYGDGIFTMSWDQWKSSMNNITVSGAAGPTNILPTQIRIEEAKHTVQNGLGSAFDHAWARDFGQTPVNQAERDKFITQNTPQSANALAGLYYQIVADPKDLEDQIKFKR